MKIRIQNADQFESLLTALLEDLVSARIHLTLYQNLVQSIKEYGREFEQSPSFWLLTINAHWDAVILPICKAYDQFKGGKPALNLPNLLDTIQANVEFFDKSKFLQRLKNNPFAESLGDEVRRPNAEQLSKDLESVSNKNAVVKRLTQWRNNVYAHRSARHALDSKAFAAEHPLSVPDIETLLDNGIDIANRYSILFNATVHSTIMSGIDDYIDVLAAIRGKLESDDRTLEEDIKRVNGSQTEVC